MVQTRIVIVDYGMGNLGSIRNMLSYIGANAAISSKISDIENADKLILSGVGAFDNGAKNIIDSDLISVLNDKVFKDKVPILGICLGMQLFAKKSEEGELRGLEWILADVVRFKFEGESDNLKIPHMGWNTVDIKKESRLFHNMPDEPRFYFVHSYHVICDEDEDILCTSHYGYDFVSVVERGNVFGVQFHPEKSHKFGMQLFKNFTELV